MYRKVKLINSLRILTIPDKNTQAVTVLVLVKVGSKYEKKEINGISHFLEHMFFKGTKKRSTQMAIAETLDKVGGDYNAFTSEEYTGYFAKVEASHFDLALDWVADIFLSSTLPSKEVQKEKGVIIEEINMYLDNPMIRVQDLWKELLYGDQPAGWNTAGTKPVIRSISRKDLFDYRKKHYIAKNALVCVAGNIEHKEAIKKVKKYFSDLTKGRDVKKPEVKEEQLRPKALLYSKQTDQTHLCLGVRSYNLFHPQKYTLQVIATILGGMMSSRLFLEIRHRLGLAYYVVTMADSNPDTGFLMTRAGVDNKKVDKAIRAILKEYQKISSKLVEPKEIQKAKDYIKGKTALALETSDALAAFYSVQEILEDEILTPKQIFEEIDKIKADDILKVSQDIFQLPKLNLALIGPFKDRKRFEKILEEF